MPSYISARRNLHHRTALQLACPRDRDLVVRDLGDRIPPALLPRLRDRSRGVEATVHDAEAISKFRKQSVSKPPTDSIATGFNVASHVVDSRDQGLHPKLEHAINADTGGIDYVASSVLRSNCVWGVHDLRAGALDAWHLLLATVSAVRSRPSGALDVADALGVADVLGATDVLIAAGAADAALRRDAGKVCDAPPCALHRVYRAILSHGRPRAEVMTCALPRSNAVTCRIRVRGGPGQLCEPGRGEPPSAALPFLSS